MNSGLPSAALAALTAIGESALKLATVNNLYGITPPRRHRKNGGISASRKYKALRKSRRRTAELSRRANRGN